MKGLVLNDLIIMRKTIAWSYLFPIVVFGIAGMGDVRMLLIGMPMVVLFLANSLVLGLFSREEASGWRVALRSFPVTASKAVAARFFVAIAVLFIVGAIVCLLEFAMAALAGIDFDCVSVGSLMGFWLITAYDSFLFPFFYRFGSGKANIATVTLVGIIIFVLYLMQRWGVASASVLLAPLPVVVAGAGLCLTVLVLVSAAISSRIVSVEFPSRHYFPASDC